MFGWEGRASDYSRGRRGELEERQLPIDPVRYVTYDEEVFTEVGESNDLAFLTFSVDLQVKVLPTLASVSPTLPIPILAGVAGGVVVVVFLVILVVAIVCVSGRSRKDRPKRKPK